MRTDIASVSQGEKKVMVYRIENKGLTLFHVEQSWKGHTVAFQDLSEAMAYFSEIRERVTYGAS